MRLLRQRRGVVGTAALLLGLVAFWLSWTAASHVSRPVGDGQHDERARCPAAIAFILAEPRSVALRETVMKLLQADPDLMVVVPTMSGVSSHVDAAPLMDAMPKRVVKFSIPWNKLTLYNGWALHEAVARYGTEHHLPGECLRVTRLLVVQVDAVLLCDVKSVLATLRRLEEPLLLVPLQPVAQKADWFRRLTSSAMSLFSESFQRAARHESQLSTAWDDLLWISPYLVMGEAHAVMQLSRSMVTLAREHSFGQGAALEPAAAVAVAWLNRSGTAFRMLSADHTVFGVSHCPAKGPCSDKEGRRPFFFVHPSFCHRQPEHQQAWGVGSRPRCHPFSAPQELSVVELNQLGAHSHHCKRSVPRAVVSAWSTLVWQKPASVKRVEEGMEGIRPVERIGCDKRSVVLSSCVGMKAADVRQFVVSFARAHRAACTSLRLFVLTHQLETFRSEFRSFRNVNFVAVDGSAGWHSRNVQRRSFSLENCSVVNARMEWSEQWLRDAAQGHDESAAGVLELPYDFVALADARDVLFQADLFGSAVVGDRLLGGTRALNQSGTVVLVGERTLLAEATLFSSDVHFVQRSRTIATYGEEFVFDVAYKHLVGGVSPVPVINAGVMVGHYFALVDFLTLLRSTLRSLGPGCGMGNDQGAVQGIAACGLMMSAFPHSVRLVLSDSESSPITHMFRDYHDLYFESADRPLLVDCNGSLYSLVHQFDLFPTWWFRTANFVAPEAETG